MTPAIRFARIAALFIPLISPIQVKERLLSTRFGGEQATCQPGTSRLISGLN